MSANISGSATPAPNINAASAQPKKSPPIIYVSGATEVYREYHIYKAGTLNSDSPKEVNFSGIMRFSDLDKDEGNKIVQGYHGAWVMSTTQLSYSEQADGRQWLGTQSTTDLVAASQLWIEIDSTPSTPAIITYKTSGSRHSNIGFSSINLVYTTKLPDGTTEQTTKAIAKYGTYTITDPEWKGENPEDYTFSGWFSDPGYTKEQEYSITLVSEDLTLYGYWAKTATNVTIEVEDENGTVTFETDADDAKRTENDDGSTTFSGLEPGKTLTVKYEPKDGYELDKVIIDDEEIDLETYKNSYTITIDDELKDYKIIVSFKEKPTPVEPDVPDDPIDPIENPDDDLFVPEVPDTGFNSNESLALESSFLSLLISFSLFTIVKLKSKRQ